MNALVKRIAQEGYAFVEGTRMRECLAAGGALDDWEAFAGSWGRLELDRYMADEGRYRRRRHAVYRIGADGKIVREPHQPHFQSIDYNPLNGGVARWFEPVAPDIGASHCLITILGFCRALFSALAPEVPSWHVEVHQFRIEAHAGEEGRPTPEGMHRDGVDFVLVLMITRSNIASGTTTIDDHARHELGSFTLNAPFDAALVDDARVFHGVTPVEPIDPRLPAFRDVLVVTFRRNPSNKINQY
ncbi:MAG TPA: 2OG-Fe dioxygenase family protein [Stellaceae bacterium]|nr:2OG-Fe dioxygenase family protein [Stellaceae bacterium]